MIVLAAVIGAIAFRFRGGLWNRYIPRGDFVGRLVFALAVAALLMPDWRRASAMAIGLFAAACIPLGNSIDLGHIEGNWLQDRIILALRGLAYSVFPWVLVVLVPGASHFAFWFLPVGALMWLAYEIGWWVPLRMPGFAQGPEVGEALFGAALGVALVLA